MTYHWTHQTETDATTVPGSWYHVVVMKDDIVLVDEWFDANQICDGVECAAYFVDKINPAIAENGTYSWWVEAYVDGNNRIWSAEATFMINVPLPVEVVRIAPINDAVVAGVQLQWQHQDGVTWYEVAVQSTGGYSYAQWHEAAQLCGANICALNMNITAADTYEWYVRAYSAAGMGPWQADPTTFIIEGNVPGEIARLNPNGTVSTGLVEFTWTQDAHAAWYNVLVQDLTTNNIVIDRWSEAVNICADSTWSITADALSNGNYSWYVRGWSGGGYGPWQTMGMDFTLSMPVPAAPMLTAPAPNGTVSAGAITLTWPVDTAASWYRIYVGAPNGCNQQVGLWYGAANFCDGVTCSVQINLSAGSYGVWMQAWGPGGTGS